MIQPPLIQRTGDVNQALADEDDDANPLFTPKRSNEHKTTLAAGPEGRQALSPSVKPPNKMSKPAEQLTNGDSDMQDKRPHAQTGEPGTSGDEEVGKC